MGEGTTTKKDLTMTHKKNMEVWQNIYFFRSQASSPRKCLYFGLDIHLFLDKKWTFTWGGGAKAFGGEGNRGWEGHWALHYIHVC